MCNEEITKIAAIFDRLLKTKTESDEKAILAQKEAYAAKDSVASSIEVVRNNNGSMAPSVSAQLPSPGIAGVLLPELNQHHQNLQTNLEHQQAKLQSEQTQTNQRLQNLAMQSEQNKNNTTQAINKHENKMAADLAAAQAETKQKMVNLIEEKKAEHKKKLETFSGTPDERATLIREHEQLLISITQNFEDTLSGMQEGYDSSVSLMRKIKSNGGL